MTLAEMGLFFCVTLFFIFYGDVLLFLFFKRCIENKSCSLLRGDITEPLQIEEYLKSIYVLP